MLFKSRQKPLNLTNYNLLLMSSIIFIYLLNSFRSYRISLTKKTPEAYSFLFFRAALWRQSMGITNHKIRREGCFRRFMICSKHFTKNSYRNKYCNKLNPNAVPTLLPLIPTEKNQNTGNAENCNSNRGETVSEIGKFEFVGVEGKVPSYRN